MSATIKNYGTLKAAIKEYVFREDAKFINRIPDFINSPHVRIQEIVGQLAALENDDDTNYYLQYSFDAYLFGALYYASKWLREPELANSYYNDYQTELRKLMNASGYDVLRMSPSGQVV